MAHGQIPEFLSFVQFVSTRGAVTECLVSTDPVLSVCQCSCPFLATRPDQRGMSRCQIIFGNISDQAITVLERCASSVQRRILDHIGHQLLFIGDHGFLLSRRLCDLQIFITSPCIPGGGKCLLWSLATQWVKSQQPIPLAS